MNALWWSSIEGWLAWKYTGRRPITRGVVWRWRYFRQSRSGAWVPLSIREGRRVGQLLWALGFDYETSRRWS